MKPSAGDAALAVLRWRNAAMAPWRSVWSQAHATILHRGLPGVGAVDRAFDAMRLLRLPAERVRPLIRDAYASGNARLFASLGKDITEYDYPQPGRD